MPPQGFRLRGEIPRRNSSNSRILRKVLTVEIYSHTVSIEKISICLNRGREESVGKDDVFIVCARKCEMVRMTYMKNKKNTKEQLTIGRFCEIN